MKGKGAVGVRGGVGILTEDEVATLSQENMQGDSKEGLKSNINHA